MGVFSEYLRNSDIRDFEEKNIIYGWNYSGKTTLSRLISYLDKDTGIDEDYKNIEFEVELSDGSKINNTNISTSPLLVKVFNSDFIKNNLHFDSSDEERKITGIKFAVGDAGDILGKIQEDEKYIERAQKIIDYMYSSITAFKSFDSKFTIEAKHLTDILSLGRNFNRTNIENYINSWRDKDLKDFVIKDKNELQRTKTNATSQNTGKTIDTEPAPTTAYKVFVNEIKDILQKSPARSNDDALLSSDNELYNWAKTGLDIYKKKEPKLERCAFCGSELADNRLQELNAFYSNEAAKVKNEIEQLKSKINAEKTKFDNLEWSNKSENDLAQSLQSDYVQKKNEYPPLLTAYKDSLDKLVVKLDLKLNESLFLPVELGAINDLANKNMETWINSVKAIFEQSNDVIAKFDETQSKAKEKYKKHHIASFLIDEDYRRLKARKDTIEKRIEKIQHLISQKKNEIQEYENKLDSVDKGKEELNDFIKRFLNREDLEIDVTEDKYFILNRNGKLATHLSDGEKTVIAFSHFMVVLKSLKDEDKLKDYIIFIDDPISSLDANHIAQVYSLINSFFFQKGLDSENPEKVCNCFQQLFISTHNFEFFSFLKDSNYINKKRKVAEGDKKIEKPACNYYMIKKTDSCSSTVINIPKALSAFKSEYVYLFSEIESFKNGGYPEDRAYMMPNIVRRFLEIYTLMKLPGNKDEIDNRIRILFESKFGELKILHNFSHFTSLERMTRHSELIFRIQDVIEALYKILEEDIVHLNSLRDGIGN